MAKRLHAMGNPAIDNDQESKTLRFERDQMHWRQGYAAAEVAAAARIRQSALSSDLFQRGSSRLRFGQVCRHHLVFLPHAHDLATNSQLRSFTKRARRLQDEPRRPLSGSVCMSGRLGHLGRVSGVCDVARQSHLRGVPAASAFSEAARVVTLGPVQMDAGQASTGVKYIQPVRGRREWPRAIRADGRSNVGRAIRDQCVSESVPFFFKQWGGVNHRTGRVLDGRTWDRISPVELTRT